MFLNRYKEIDNLCYAFEKSNLTTRRTCSSKEWPAYQNSFVHSPTVQAVPGIRCIRLYTYSRMIRTCWCRLHLDHSHQSPSYTHPDLTNEKIMYTNPTVILIKGTLKSKYCIIIIFYINPIYKMSKIECMWKECIWKHISFNLKWEYMYSWLKKFFKSYQSRPVRSRVSLGWWFPGPPPAGCPWSWGSSWGAYWCCWWPLHPDATVVLPHHNYTSCR